MLANDQLGASREDNGEPLNANYTNVFKSISNDPNNELIVAELNGNIVGMLQLTFIPYLTHTGSWRCLIEGVRVSAEYRGGGLGRALLEWAINRAKDRGVAIVQLTSDKKREDAIRFYQGLGFTASHEGFKLTL